MEGGLLSLKWNNHRSSFIHVLSSLRKKDSFCDVTLACDGKFYPSHKLVLSTCSDYFQEMFQQTQCKHPVIVLKDIRSEDLEALLNYMYVGEVNVIQEKLSTLIKAAECLRIKGLAVPDDPPKDSTSERRSSMQQDFAPESKRRKLDSEHHRSKDLYRTHKQSKSTDSNQYRPSTVPVPEDSFQQSPINQSDDGNVDPRNFNFDTRTDGDTSNLSKAKEREGEFIKQEPPDNFIDLEDTKEGILQSSHPQFLSPAHRQDDVSNIDAVGTSDSQDIWGSESRSGDDYPPLERGENSGPGNDDPSQSDSVAVAPPRAPGTQQLELFKLRKPCNFTHYVCPICGKRSYFRKDHLKHIRIHTGEKPYQCQLCCYRSAQSSNLLTHMRRVHYHHEPQVDQSA